VLDGKGECLKTTPQEAKRCTNLEDASGLLTLAHYGTTHGCSVMPTSSTDGNTARLTVARQKVHPDPLSQPTEALQWASACVGTPLNNSCS
jgi:hypothetical protein